MTSKEYYITAVNEIPEALHELCRNNVIVATVLKSNAYYGGDLQTGLVQCIIELAKVHARQGQLLERIAMGETFSSAFLEVK